MEMLNVGNLRIRTLLGGGGGGVKNVLNVGSGIGSGNVPDPTCQ